MTIGWRWIGAFAIALCLAATAVISAPADGPPQPGRVPVKVIPVMAALGDPMNLDPIVSPNPFVVVPNQTRTLPLTIDAPLPNATVTLSVACCTDAITNQTVSPPGLTLSIAPTQVRIDAFHHTAATLTVNALSTPTGSFLIGVHVDNAGRNIHELGKLLVNVVKVPPEGTAPTCSRLAPPGGTPVEVLPLSLAIHSVLDAKEATPSRTSFSIGAASADQIDGWLLSIDNGGPLKPSLSNVILKNSTVNDKQVLALDASCNPISPTQIVQSGHTAMMTIFNPATSTLLLQRLVCRTWLFFCWSRGWDDVAVLSPSPFWTLFGGRQVTIDWKVSQGDR
jgi:hypothetical protein